MKKTVFVFMLLFAVLLSAKSYKDWDHLPIIGYNEIKFGTDKTLDIATWNIERFPKRGDTTVVYIANCIKSMDIDLVGMQEVRGRKAFLDIINELNKLDKKNKWKGYRAKSDEKWQMNLAFIYKSNIIKVNKIYELYNTKDGKYRYEFPRFPLVIDFQYKGKKFIAINNHLKARNKEKDIKRRIAALGKLHSYSMENFPKDNLIILGDMNDQLVDADSVNVFGIFLKDKKNFRFADYKIAADSTANWSYPYWKYRGHIDHIIISNELYRGFKKAKSEVKTIAIDKFMEGGDEARYQFITDHRPVAIRLMVK